MTQAPFSPDAAALPRAGRLTTILLIGRVSTSTRDDLCRVRNISADGMRIETLAPLTVGQHLEVELKNGVIVRSEVVWVVRDEAGVRFDEPVDIKWVLGPPEPSKRRSGPQIMRSPRVSARCPVALRRDGRIVSALLLDVSQSGVQLQWSDASSVGTQVVLLIPGFASRRAMVRRVQGDAVGLSVFEKFGFADLAEWLAGPDRFTAHSPAQLGDRLSQSR